MTMRQPRDETLMIVNPGFRGFGAMAFDRNGNVYGIRATDGRRVLIGNRKISRHGPMLLADDGTVYEVRV
jgi:hypothetical protein